MCTDCDEITQGIPGYNGWSPTFQTVIDNVNLDGDGNPRVVLQLTGWIGGEGPTPTNYVNQYLTTTGYTSDISLATNIKGPKGEQGIQGIQGIQGPAGNTGTDFSGSGAPVTPGGSIGDTYLDTDTGDIYTWDGSTWVLTDVSPVNPTNILALDMSTIAKQCLLAYIGGNTLEDYLAGMIDYICDIGGGGSSPTYDTQVVFAFDNSYNNGGGLSFPQRDTLIFQTPTAAVSFFESLPLHIEGKNKFTVPAGVTAVQFELYGGGGSSTSGSGSRNNAFIAKSDGSLFYYATSGSSAIVDLGATDVGLSNCPVAISGNPGTDGDGVSIEGVSGLGVGPTPYNFGSTPPALTGDGGHSSGAYGKVTLPVTAGDIFYIYVEDESMDNTSAKVIVSYNA